MQNFDDSSCTHQIHQTFPLSKFYAIRYVIIGVFRYFQSVVECPDLLLMFSLFVTDKEFLCCVLDIVSVFAGKLVIDN